MGGVIHANSVTNRISHHTSNLLWFCEHTWSLICSDAIFVIVFALHKANAPSLSFIPYRHLPK